MKNKAWMCLAVSLIMIVILGACSKPASTDNVQNPKDSAAQSPSSGKKPEFLPADFPLPKDAAISTSHSETNDGKKSVLLVFTTKEGMPAVTKLYKDYFKTQNLSDDAQTIDDKNIIIQGENKQKKQSWSMIGGVMASKEGVIELTVTWSEL